MEDFVIKSSGARNFPEKILYSYSGTESEVRVPDGVTKICSFAFSSEDTKNDTITKIFLPDSVMEIDWSAFENLAALTEIRFPENDKFCVLDLILKGCDSLEKIAIPKTIVGVNMLIMPPNLKKVEFHDGLIFVRPFAFLYESDFSDSEKKFRMDITIEMLLKSENYQIIDGFMVNKSQSVALFLAEHNKKKVRVPDGIKRVSRNCFDEYGYFLRGVKKNPYLNQTIIPVERVIFPKSVEEVANGAFVLCKKMKDLTYEGNPADLNLPNQAFEYCSQKMDSLVLSGISSSKPKKGLGNIKIDRMTKIHKEIKSGSFPSAFKLVEILKKELGLKKLSVSSVYRDIEYLRDRWNAPIEYDEHKKGYFYTIEDFSLKFD